MGEKNLTNQCSLENDFFYVRAPRYSPYQLGGLAGADYFPCMT
jgi:hypothetical protein